MRGEGLEFERGPWEWRESESRHPWQCGLDFTLDEIVVQVRERWAELPLDSLFKHQVQEPPSTRRLAEIPG